MNAKEMPPGRKPSQFSTLHPDELLITMAAHMPRAELAERLSVSRDMMRQHIKQARRRLRALEVDTSGIDEAALREQVSLGTPPHEIARILCTDETTIARAIIDYKVQHKRTITEQKPRPPRVHTERPPQPKLARKKTLFVREASERNRSPHTEIELLMKSPEIHTIEHALDPKERVLLDRIISELASCSLSEACSRVVAHFEYAPTQPIRLVRKVERLFKPQN